MMSWQCDGTDYDPSMTNLSSSSCWELRMLPIFLLHKASHKPGTKIEDWEDMYILGSVYLKDLGHTTKQPAPLDPSHNPEELSSKGASQSFSPRLLSCLALEFPESTVKLLVQVPPLWTMCSDEWGMEYANGCDYTPRTCNTGRVSLAWHLNAPLWLWLKGAPMKISSYMWSFGDIGKQWNL